MRSCATGLRLASLQRSRGRWQPWATRERAGGIGKNVTEIGDPRESGAWGACRVREACRVSNLPAGPTDIARRPRQPPLLPTVPCPQPSALGNTIFPTAIFGGLEACQAKALPSKPACGLHANLQRVPIRPGRPRPPNDGRRERCSSGGGTNLEKERFNLSRS